MSKMLSDFKLLLLRLLDVISDVDICSWCERLSQRCVVADVAASFGS
jgi:hypothetical protein